MKMSERKAVTSTELPGLSAVFLSLFPGGAATQGPSGEAEA